MAVNRVTSIKSLAQAALKEDPILESALARFCEEDKVKAKQLAMEQERDSIWREQALKKEKELELKHQQLVATTPNKKEKKKKKKLKHLKLEMIRWLGF
jgi:flagellar biosynthesis GTPase FlhF